MSFFRKMQKELEQKSNSESQINQPIIEFLQSAATSDIGRVDLQVISDFVSSEKSVNRSQTSKGIPSGNMQQKMAMLIRSGNSKQNFQT